MCCWSEFIDCIGLFVLLIWTAEFQVAAAALRCVATGTQRPVPPRSALEPNRLHFMGFLVIPLVVPSFALNCNDDNKKRSGNFCSIVID